MLQRSEPPAGRSAAKRARPALSFVSARQAPLLLPSHQETDILLNVEHTKLVVDAMVSLLPYYLQKVDFDLSISNFMIRPSNGDVVLSDPLHGLSDISAEWRRYRQGESVIFEKR